MNPLVCVVVPCRNRAEFLIPTLESILQQDYPHIECIVVDAASTDATLDILRRYEGRIRWISEPDHGPYEAINNGWRMSRGEVLAWLNADDLWAPGAVRQAVSHLQEHPEADVVYGDCGLIDRDGNPICTLYVQDWDLKYAVEYCEHIIHQPASFMRRSIVERIGWLWPNWCHDHELWLRISLAQGRLQRMPALLAYGRHHEGNCTCMPDTILPLKMKLTREFFDNPSLPVGFAGLRNRAISNCYLKGIDYIFWSGFRWFRDTAPCLRLLYRAIKADASNGRRVLKYLLDLVLANAGIGRIVPILKRYLPSWLYLWLRNTKRQVVKRLFPEALV